MGERYSPFSVRDDDTMKETVESVKGYGVLMPDPGRTAAMSWCPATGASGPVSWRGLETMPVIVRDLDRDTAIIYMVDSNIQRENISPMEKAQAYKMKLDAIRRRAGRIFKA